MQALGFAIEIDTVTPEVVDAAQFEEDEEVKEDLQRKSEWAANFLYKKAIV